MAIRLLNTTPQRVSWLLWAQPAERAPRLSYDVVKDFSRAIVRHLAQTIPGASPPRADRPIASAFVDYLRNKHGATTAAAFSARARPGLGVSMPVAWEQLATLKGGAQWTISTAREHLSF